VTEQWRRKQGCPKKEVQGGTSKTMDQGRGLTSRNGRCTDGILEKEEGGGLRDKRKARRGEGVNSEGNVNGTDLAAEGRRISGRNAWGKKRQEWWEVVKW